MSSYNLIATLMIRIEDKKLRKALYDALLPDIKTPASLKIAIEIEESDNSLLLKFRTKDLSGLRAAINSFLRLAYSIKTSLEAVSSKQIS